MNDLNIALSRLRGKRNKYGRRGNLLFAIQGIKGERIMKLNR